MASHDGRNTIYLAGRRSLRPLYKLFRKIKNMMLPIRDDCCPSDDDEQSCCSCFCKVIGVCLILIVIGICGILFSHITDLIYGYNDIPLEPEPPLFPPSRKCKQDIGDRTKEELKAWVLREIQSNINVCTRSRMNTEIMRHIVRNEIKRQQRSQLKPDFASSSAGGMVLYASPTWTAGYSLIYFLFIPIRSTAPSPSILLEPTRQAGDCWPMKGAAGRLVIQLAARATIIGFTLEHIHPAMSLSGTTLEAPKNFSVYGLDSSENLDHGKHKFGTYFYDNKNEEENQYFRVQSPEKRSFLYVELEIHSNHGNEKYTCIYRFQVHGYIDQAYHCN